MNDGFSVDGKTRSNKIIVGICGEIDHGKTTLANRICDYLNCASGAPRIQRPAYAKVRKIAEPLYVAGEAIVGEPVDKAKTYQVGDRLMTGRMLLQELADHFRAVDKRSLVQSVVNHAQACESSVILCDDVRTPECSSICDVLIGVVCRNKKASGDCHETEQYVQEHLRRCQDVLYWTDDGSCTYETHIANMSAMNRLLSLL